MMKFPRYGGIIILRRYDTPDDLDDLGYPYFLGKLSYRTNLKLVAILGMIPLINHDFQWGRTVRSL